MTALIASFLPLLGRLEPELIGLALGERAPAVAGAVEAALRDLFGTADPGVVQAALEADPSKAQALQARLGRVTETLRAQAADAADAAAGARAATVELVRAGSAVAWGSPVVSAIVVAAFAAVAVVVFTKYGVDSAVGQLIAGALIAKFGTVVDYWLGSSKGSSDRADRVTAMLHQALDAAAGASARDRRVRP